MNLTIKLIGETVKKGIQETRKQCEKSALVGERSMILPEARRAMEVGDVLGGLRTDMQISNWNTVCTERRPENVIRDVSRRLMREGFSLDVWNASDVEERKALLRNAAKVMSQEMLLPKDVRDQIVVRFEPMTRASGVTNSFIEPVESTGEFKITKQPIITLDETRLNTGDGIENLGTLFHEMTHVMQQASIAEQRPWTENVSYWKNSLLENGRFDTWTEYATGSLEAYAHANTALFKKAFRSDNISAKHLREAPVALKSTEATGLASYDRYESAMRNYQWHLENARRYERKANELERAIQRRKEDPSKTREVNRLRSAAESEKREAKRCQQEASRALRFPETAIHFTGGLGAENIKHIRGSQMVSEAKSKRAEASRLSSQAKILESKGKSGADYELRAASLKREASSLEKKGKALMG